MELTLLVALVGAGGVVLGSILGFFGTWLTNHYSLRVQREQWEREAKRASEEAAEHRQAQEREYQYRDRKDVEETYSSCLQYLAVLTRYNAESSAATTWLEAFRDDLRQAENALSRLVMTYPTPNETIFTEFFTSYTDLVKPGETPAATIKTAGYLRYRVINLCRKDPRLHS